MRPSLSSVGAALALTVALGCRTETPERLKGAPVTASGAPIDRLAPGELAAGKTRVFGFEIPLGMTVRGAFMDVAYVQGEVTPEALANYVRERVEVERVEIGAARTVFPSARIKGGDPARLYELEVAATKGPTTDLIIRDVTPKPSLPDQMTDEQRWRAAGRAPDGKPLDISELR